MRPPSCNDNYVGVTFHHSQIDDALTTADRKMPTTSEAKTLDNITAPATNVTPRALQAQQLASRGEGAANSIVLKLGQRLRRARQHVARARLRALPAPTVSHLEGAAFEAFNALQAAKLVLAESIAGVPLANDEPVEREQCNLSKLPDFCYALIVKNVPGRRIVAIKAGVRGHYVTSFDGVTMDLAEARILVDRLNVRMGVTDAQHQAMIAGSNFGFHVPAADPEHPANTGDSPTDGDG